MDSEFCIEAPQDRNARTHKAVTDDGTEINIGDAILDFRGESWRFLGITRLPTRASSGRVYADGAPVNNYKSEFFPSVFDLTIVERTEK